MFSAKQGLRRILRARSDRQQILCFRLCARRIERRQHRLSGHRQQRQSTAINSYDEYDITGSNKRGPYASDTEPADAIETQSPTQCGFPVYPAVYTKRSYRDDSVRIHMNDHK